jgi:hypothetical protein
MGITVDGLDYERDSTIREPKIPTDAAVDERTAQKINRSPTIRELFDASFERSSASVDLQASIIKYLTLMSKMSTDKREQITELKKKHEASYKKSAELTSQIGNNRFMAAMAALPPALLGLSPNRLDGIVGEQLSRNVVPGLGAMWTSGKEASQVKANAVQALALQEYSQETSTTQSEANNRGELTRIIADQGDALKKGAGG